MYDDYDLILNRGMFIPNRYSSWSGTVWELRRTQCQVLVYLQRGLIQ